MKLLNLFTLFISLLSISITYSQIDTISIQSAFHNVENDINQLTNELDTQIVASQKVIDDLNKIITLSSTNTAKKIEALNKKLVELEKLNTIKEENVIKKNERRYEAGKIAIADMKSGIKILNFTYKLLDLDQSIELTTNLWSDSTFRNGWNKLEDWGTILGMGVAVGGGAVLEKDKQITSMISGLSIAGLSKLLGTILGINEKKFRRKMERIDLSIRAYDNLKIRNKQLQLFIENNLDFKTRIETLEINYLNAKQKDRGIQMTTLIDMLDEYKTILKQIPIYLDGISSVSESYINNKELYKELPMKDIFNGISEKIEEIKIEYENEIRPLFNISPEIKKLILGID